MLDFFTTLIYAVVLHIGILSCNCLKIEPYMLS